MNKIFYILLVGLATSSCEKDAKDAEKNGRIYGAITDMATGEHIISAGVQLRPSGKTTVTGSDGRYEFLDVEPGNYFITVSKTGYSELIDDYPITVKAGKDAPRDAQIKKLMPSLRIVDDSKQDISKLDFGETNTTRSFSIFNDGPISIKWVLTENSEWIANVSKDNGNIVAGDIVSVIVTIDRSKMNGGVNTANIYITSNNGNKELAIVGTVPRPTLTTQSANDVTASSATLNGTITSSGTPAYTERGFVYATTSQPTLENSIVKITAPVTSNVNFSASATNLTINTTYYVRAFATNSGGTSYGNEVSFTTGSSGILPVVTTSNASNIAATSAAITGNITSRGTPTFTEKGFVLNTSPSPTITNNIKKVSSPDTRDGVFTLYALELTSGTTYYVRAYATNSAGTAYGEDKTFTTSSNAVLPTVTTSNVSNITGTGATLNGSIISNGTPAYTERGFVYSTSSAPTTSNAVKRIVTGTGIGAFTVTLTGLSSGTIYYVRAYATNTAGTVYGAEITFTVSATSSDYVVLGSIAVQKTDISGGYTTVNLRCQLSSVGGFSNWRLPTVTELETIYTNRATIGGFSTSFYYWSSTSAGGTDNWQIDFSDGSRYAESVFTDYEDNARCVRTLP